MVADIASGNTGAADIVFLIAVILCGLAILSNWIESAKTFWYFPLIASVGCIALGLLLL